MHLLSITHFNLDLSQLICFKVGSSLPRTVVLQLLCWDSEMLEICRDCFGKFSTVVFVGNIAVTVPHTCLLIFCLTSIRSI